MYHLFMAALMAALTSGPREEARLLAGSAPGGGLITTTAPALQESLRRLWQGSSSWRAAVDQLQGDGRRVVLLTPDQVVVSKEGRRAPFEDDLLAEVSPIAGAGGRVRHVLVIINLPLLEESHAARLSTLREFHADLDRILAHEVYGHALPYLIAGDLSGRCADPLPGQRPPDSCAIRRENTVRAELGLGRRTDAGVYSLALARRSRD